MKGLTLFLVLVLSISVYAKTEAGLTVPGLNTNQTVKRTPNSETAKNALDLVIVLNDQSEAPRSVPASIPVAQRLLPTPENGAYTRAHADAKNAAANEKKRLEALISNSNISK